jgi:hypothetical protein
VMNILHSLVDSSHACRRRNGLSLVTFYYASL